jgi:outer membrane protein OmpA-like peptidoglycan-associated protein/Tol biopolymer transport system component
MIQFLMPKQVLFSIFTFFFFAPFYSEGQASQKVQKQFDKALQYFKVQNFSNAVEELNKIIEKTPEFQDAYLLLSDIYKETNSAELEIENLLLAQDINPKPLINYHLAEAYFSLGDYEKARQQYGIYLQEGNLSEKQTSEISRKTENCRFAIEAKKNPVEFEPERLSNKVNSANDEYWPVISLNQKKLVFTRLIRSTGQIPQEDFYFSELGPSGWNQAKPIVEINTGQNEGAQILSADGKLLFFTACNRRDGKGSCDIYYSRFKDGKWSEVKNAGDAVNSGSWEAQPGFSSDNRFLYFSSNRAGGKGGKDIWRAELKGFNALGNIVWGELKNLGDSINTEGDEISPFIHPNNRNFYFVSDYHTGMGGFDLFTSEITGDSVFSKPVNLGYPVNTNKDEQGLNISADGESAYFASARELNSGLDIYRFELDKSIRPTPVTYVKANVTDKKTGQSIQAGVNLVDLLHPEIIRTEKTDEAGELLVCLPLGTDYAFNVSKEGYLFYSQSFQLSDTKTIQEPYIFTIELQPIELGAEMNLYNIYFETDSFTILPASEPELNRLIVFLNNNPKLSVEIQGHTDNTGNEEKNQKLSELRAKSVADYLIDKGTEASRLSHKGFGQRHPVASNETEDGRKRNRRTTIKIR